MSDSSSEANNFNTAAAAISLCTLVPFIYALFFWWRPSARMRVLNTLLRETEERFRSVIEDGLMMDDEEMQKLYTRLWMLKSSVEDIRVEVYNTKSLWKEVVGWWMGLSNTANAACEDLKDIMEVLSKRSSGERKSRGAQAYRVFLASRLQYQQALVQGSLVSQPAVGRSHRSIDVGPSACGEQPDPTNRSPTARRLRLKAEADKRRRLLVQFGKYLLESHTPEAQPRHPSMVPISAERRRRGQARSLMRSMTRYLRRKFGQHQGKSSATTEDDIIDVDRALFASLQPVSDAETDWEDVAHVGRIRLVA